MMLLGHVLLWAVNQLWQLELALEFFEFRVLLLEEARLHHPELLSHVSELAVYHDVPAPLDA